MKIGTATGETLTNLRFADDVLSIASSLNTLRKMMVELDAEVQKIGLQMHMGKTKVLTSSHGRRLNKTCVVGAMRVFNFCLQTRRQSILEGM